MPKAIREAYGEELTLLGAENPDVVVLDADVSASTRTVYFAQRFPDRFFNVGIAEANMVCMAAGLAAGGKTVFVNAFSAFLSTIGLLPARSLIAYGKGNVKLMGAYGGLSDALDGSSHHSIDDLAAFRAIPGMRVMVASDEAQVRWLVREAAITPGPMYIRLSRDAMRPLPRLDGPFKMGRGSLLREGNDIAILACGMLCGPALEAAEALAGQGIQARVIDLFTLKPLDEEIIRRCAQETRGIVTAEEHSVLGGLGGAVCEVVSSLPFPVRVERVGIPDCFTQSGAYGELLACYHLDSGGILDAASKILS